MPGNVVSTGGEVVIKVTKILWDFYPGQRQTEKKKKNHNKMYNISVGGVLEKNKAGNGARACWDVAI